MGPTKHPASQRTDRLKHRKGATKNLPVLLYCVLNTAMYDEGPDNPKPNPNLTLTLS